MKSHTKKKKVYGYIRVSGKGQIDGDGLVRQETSIRRYVEQNGMELVRVFSDEGISGTKFVERNGLIEMLYSLKKNGTGVKMVVIESLSRVSRDIVLQEKIIREIESIGGQLVSVQDGQELVNCDSTRKLIRQILGCINEWDKDQIVSRLKIARDRKKRDTGVKVEGRKNYKERHPEVVKLIKSLWRKQKGIPYRPSFESISRQLNQRGHKTIGDKNFSGGIVRNIVMNSGKWKMSESTVK